MYNTIAIEDLKTPAVALYNEGFFNDARSAASGKGVPGLRAVALTVPCECSVLEQVEAGLGPAVIDRIVAALTKPLTRDEEAPRQQEERPTRIAFKGSLEEVNRFFYRRGWGDGLPIIPPTAEAVAEMLAGTDLPPDHVVTKIIPRLGKATVEKIAVNAVMAGALPTYMPLLIAAVQALMEPRGWYGTYQVSTGSWAPCLIINGPVRKALHLNSGSGMMSPGDLANAAIGRALGLIVKNIGGARKGIEDMGVMGNPMKYSLAIAENEEESPWEPLHVQQGLRKDDNAVTVFYPNSLLQMMAYGSESDALLRTVTYNLPPARGGLVCLTLIPAHARMLAGDGWGKQEVAAFVAENARVPLQHHPEYWGANLGSEGKQFPKSPMDSPQQSVAILNSPEKLRVVVAGGPGSFIGLMMGGHGVGPDGWVTKKMELPVGWEKLVEKYKGLVPAYAKY